MQYATAQRYPAMMASATLHVVALLAGLIAWPWLNKPIHMSSVTSVTLMTTAELESARAAIRAPAESRAASETPAPKATPEPPAPTPAPTPTPPKPAPKVAPIQPAPATKASTKPAKQTPSVDLDALAASVAQSNKATGARQSSAQSGPARPETAVQARVSEGQGATASATALSSMQATLERLWNPNCEVMGGSDVNITVKFRLSSGGRLVGQPVSSAQNAADPIVRAASDRAIRAVNAGQPFADLPAEAYTTNFNAKHACDNR